MTSFSSLYSNATSTAICKSVENWSALITDVQDHIVHRRSNLNATVARRPKGFFHSFPLEVRQKGYVGVTHQAKEGEIGRTCRWFLFPGWYISASSLIPQTSKVICHVGHSSLFFPLSNIFPPLLQLAQFFYTNHTL